MMIAFPLGIALIGISSFNSIDPVKLKSNRSGNLIE
jgi:hypothetical protein